MKVGLTGAVLIFTATQVLFSQQNDTRAASLTIYNNDLAVVRTGVDLDLKKGINEITTTKVTSQLEPDSVVLRDAAGQHMVQVTEQNYDAALASQPWMLQKYEGQIIDFQVVHGEHVETVQGKILRSGQDGNDPLIEVNGKMQFSLPGQPLFPASTDGLLLKPTLRWQIYSDTAEHFPAELSYLTHGFNWNATYNVVSSEGGASGSGDETMDLVGWVTISNRSGTDFDDARVKLMAGDVNRLAGGVAGGVPVGVMMMKAAAEPAPVTQQAFDDFHLYDLNRQVSLRNGETKQVEFLRTAKIPVTRRYLYDGASPSPRRGVLRSGSVDSNQTVRIEQSFLNTKENHLGMPLPAGTMRFYRRDKDGQMEFVGENQIQHTPEGEKIELSTGSAFDITGNRTRTDFKTSSEGNVTDESIEITVRNAKETPVNVDVVEHLNRTQNWDIVEKSAPFEKRNSAMVVFPVSIPAHGQQKITYTIHYTW